jgi:CubicO group peptidase (beta-lactamase class C family)
MVHGTVADGFEAVRDAFAENFARRGELGAACAAYRDGVKIVDLWGGRRDRTGAPWTEDTLVMVYSTSKGMAATAIALAHSRGWLDYDDRVADHWPEFAQKGKGRITVRQLLSHQAGLCAVDERLDPRRLGDLDGLAEVLARQTPAWTPGTRHGYHAHSLGWYEGELIRRVDPEHRSLGRFFAEEIARPLDLSFYFGLPDDLPAERVASVKGTTIAGALRYARAMPPRMVAAFVRPSSLTARVFTNPRVLSAADLDAAAYRPLEMPSSGGIGTARSIARVYGDLATGAEALGIGAPTLAELSAPPRPPSGSRRDLVLMVETAYSLGYIRPSSLFRFGSDERAFGHPGAGGSFGFADPAAGVGFAYAPNRLGPHLRDDPREKAVRDALYRCLGSTRARAAA